MQTDTNASPAQSEHVGHCPIDHTAYSHQKTAREVEKISPHIERDAEGIWHARSFEATRAVLRANGTKQWGFGAPQIERLPTSMRQPILYQEGQEHHQQRRQTAKFFTPKAVSDNYREMMERFTDQLIEGMRRKDEADLSAVSMSLAVRVAAEVIGLTNSRLPGMDRRLDAFFKGQSQQHNGIISKLAFALNQTLLMQFFVLDVLPAIAARKRAPREDLISHLISQGYKSFDILTECLTYGAAGMATTREFVSVATWHFIEQPALRARYLVAGEEERQAMLHEILRLEPVIENLYRRATEDVTLDIAGVSMTIPAGDIINLHINAANTDPEVAGDDTLAICPAREIRAKQTSEALMSFGDGHHRCPGAFLAIQETDIFLRRLLAIESLHIVQPPTLTWSDVTAGYELRQFMVALH